MKNCVIWGNHSSTQYPDVNHASVIDQGGSKTVRAAVQDDNWLNNDFIKVKKYDIVFGTSFLEHCSAISYKDK